jgi:hypothetical protein
VQKRELALARQWRTSRTATPAQKAYSAALLSGGGGGSAGATQGAEAGGGELQALFEERRARMEAEAAQLAQSALAAAAGGGDADAERPAPVLRARVAGAAPCAADWAAGCCLGDAVLRLWRVSEEEDALREGDVLRVTGLRAARSVDLGMGRMLQLDATKMTRWGGAEGEVESILGGRGAKCKDWIASELMRALASEIQMPRKQAFKLLVASLCHAGPLPPAFCTRAAL